MQLYRAPMHPDEIAIIRAQVAQLGAKIQPLLHPHGALAKRNAYAHLWLGIRTVFGETWREGAISSEIEGFVRWIGENPNEDYEAFTGPVSRISLQSESIVAPKAPIDPGLFD